MLDVIEEEFNEGVMGYVQSQTDSKKCHEKAVKAYDTQVSMRPKKTPTPLPLPTILHTSVRRIENKVSVIVHFVLRP